MRDESQELFRAEALEARRRTPVSGAAELAGLPGWIRAGFWLLIALVAAAAWIGSTTRVPEYATGPAVIEAPEGPTAADPECAISGRLPASARQRVESGGEVLFRPGGHPERIVEVVLDIEPAREGQWRAPGDEDWIAVRGTLRSCAGLSAGATHGTLEVVAGTTSWLGLVPGIGGRRKGES